jgi:hypothetical protein
VDLEIPPPDDIPEVRATLEVDIDESAIGDRSLHSMSGTTVREQQSDAGDDELNPHALLTYGPTVYHTATNLIQRFDQHKPKLRQVLKGIDQPGSSTEVAFRKDVAAFQNAVLQLGEAFGGAVGLLNPDHVMEALFKQSRPSKASGSWRVTELMQLRNLAILVREVASTPIETDEMADKLSRLNVQFPLAFLDDFNMSEDSPAVMGNSYLQDDTFEVAFAIRLQTAVMEIQREFNSDGFDVGDFIHSSFYASAEDQDNLLAWDVNGLGSGDLGLLPSYANKMRAKIQLLISCVANDIQDIADGSEEGMQTLARNFPWSDFRVTLLRWAKLRMEEITASIDGANEVEGLMEEVRADLSRDDAFEPDGVASPPRSPTKQRVNVAAARYVDTHHKLNPPKSDNHRTQIRQPSVSVLPISPLRHTDGNANSNRSTQGDDDGAFQHIDEIEVARDPEIVELMGTIDENQRQRKENIRTQPAVTAGPAQRRKFVDEQADAERISNFDDATQQSPNQHRRPHSLGQTSPGKRKRIQTITEEYNVSDDDGYQTDSREVDMSQRRHEAPRLGPSPKKVRIHAPDCRRRDGSTQTAEAEEDERVVEYRYQKRIMSSQAARSSQSAPQRPRLQQGRSRWSPAEELRLEELISEHGCSWAYLKSIDVDGDNMFEGRDQVALKDKARNMKTQMIVYVLQLKSYA